MAESFDSLAILAARCARPSAAARLLGAARGLRAVAGHWQSFLPPSPGDIDDVVNALGGCRFEALLAEGARLSPEQAIAYARQALGTQIQGRSGWECLTNAEFTVASLAAAGLTNAQIAARKSVSRHTVHYQLARVFAKLGVRSRAQLAAQAGRRGWSYRDGAPIGASPN